MKNYVKWFGIIAFVVVIGFSMVGCDLEEKDYEMLNGVWDRGDIIVTFSDDSAVFTQINSNSGWKQVQHNGYVSIGSRKFRNIKSSGNLKWTGQELTYNLSTYVTTWYNCTLTVSSNGQTLKIVIHSDTIQDPYSTYTKQ
ncbi:hypothetical protein FACS1894151_01050 [Spirochaetia bacterium]|nr:hypothetical protein FACS1894151_01050 [Spirochaetia bacterium]